MPQLVGRYTGQPTTTQYSWSIDKRVAHAGEFFFTEVLRRNNEIANIPWIRVTPSISARPSFLFSYFSDGARGEGLDSRLAAPRVRLDFVSEPL